MADRAQEILDDCEHIPAVGLRGAETGAVAALVNPLPAGVVPCRPCADRAVEAAIQNEREACAKLVERLKNGRTIDAITGELVKDADGPWMLKSGIAAAIRARRSP